MGKRTLHRLTIGEPLKNAPYSVNFVVSFLPYKVVRLGQKLLVSLYGIVFQRFLIIFIGLILSFSLFSNSTVAEDKSNLNPNVDQNLSLAKCIAKGNLDFGLFLNNFISADGLAGGFIEPFNDVLFRNQCQAADIAGLIHQRDKIRTYIRDAFLTCATQKIPNYKKAFNQLNVEIDYVRNVVDGKIMMSLPYELLTTRMLENEQSLYMPTDKLYTLLKKKHVRDSGMTQKDFDQFFENLQSKYKTRKKSYVICGNSSWDTVSDKFKEFIDTLGGVTPAWADAKKGIGGRAEKLVESITDVGLVDYLLGIVQLNINKLPPEKATKDILDAVNKYAPGGSPTTEDVLRSIGSENQSFNTSKIRAELSSNFSVLYRDTGDQTAQAFSEELTRLSNAMVGSMGSIDNIVSCTKLVNSKQCSGK